MSDKFKSIDSKSKAGCLILIYGDTGTGKTTSIMQSAPGRLAYIAVEAKDYKRAFQASGRKEKDFAVYNYKDAAELIDILATEKFEGFDSIAIDSLTFLNNAELSQEIAYQAFEARMENEKKEDKKITKQITNETKMSKEGYGALGAAMIRITKLLGKLSRDRNKTVICTALSKASPDYAKHLTEAAPLLTGKMYPENFAAFFDLIGYVTKLYDKDKDDNMIVSYPPKISFVSDDNDFLASVRHGVKGKSKLNFKKILGMEG